MKTQDFEQAIDALSIEIDEMYLVSGYGDVKTAWGHTQIQYVKWDEFGRGFAAEIPEERRGNDDLDPRHDVDDWERAVEFDLKFD